MQPNSLHITDIWFRSALPLEQLATAIGLTEQQSEVEDGWTWVVGYLGGIAVDVARRVSETPEAVDTRILRLDLERFSPEQKGEIVAKLRGVIASPITCGRWVHVENDQYDLQVDEVV